MIATSLLRTLHQAISTVTPKTLSLGPVLNIVNRRMHYIYNRPQWSLLPSTNTSNIGPVALLQPSLPMYNSMCGLKVRGRLERRCKDCYFIFRRERLYVMCKTHPRHKQTQMKKKEYKTWILTHASQSPKRPW